MTLSRRDLLGAAALVVLAGCGVEEAGEAPPPDAEVLDGLLQVELAAGAALIGVAGAELLARQDQAHARRLAEAAGAEPAPRSADATRDVAGALARKQDAVFAYVAALPKLADPDHRVLVMQIAASEAEQLVVLREALGERPVLDAFAGFAAGAP